MLAVSSIIRFLCLAFPLSCSLIPSDRAFFPASSWSCYNLFLFKLMAICPALDSIRLLLSTSSPQPYPIFASPPLRQGTHARRLWFKKKKNSTRSPVQYFRLWLPIRTILMVCIVCICKMSLKLETCWLFINLARVLSLWLNFESGFRMWNLKFFRRCTVSFFNCSVQTVHTFQCELDLLLPDSFTILYFS